MYQWRLVSETRLRLRSVWRSHWAQSKGVYNPFVYKFGLNKTRHWFVFCN